METSVYPQTVAYTHQAKRRRLAIDQPIVTNCIPGIILQELGRWQKYDLSIRATLIGQFLEERNEIQAVVLRLLKLPF